MSNYSTVFLPKVFMFFHVHQMYILHWGPYVFNVVEQVSGSAVGKDGEARGRKQSPQSKLGIVG
jgi:hypothetical protein